MKIHRLVPAILVGACVCSTADAAIDLIAIGSLTGSSVGAGADLSGLTGTLENGAAANPPSWRVLSSPRINSSRD